ncbi:protein lin-52 homolog [Rhopilema esculentum]|uniref:protein lin-52 homolog n=1 Tax=Rhopilema esculentum TaxID=499914 RepID=UPI0031CF3FEF
MMSSPSKRASNRSTSSRTPTKRGTPEKRSSKHTSSQPPPISLPDPDFDTSLQSLLCSQETLRSSPELWPEQMPGAVEFATIYGTSPILSKTETVASSLDSALDKEDHDMLQEFGSLTTSQLMDKVKALQNLAYQLGLEEAHEMTRGKFLNVLGKSNIGR